MKIRNKLILSCAALAAVATTAVSTTFAWYTSNTEVTATGITAQTQTTGNDTLLISSTGENGTWGPTVALGIDQNLVPLALGKAGNGTDGASTPAEDLNLYAWNPESNAVSTAASVAEATNYIQFSLFFKNQTASVATGIYLKELTITNTTTTVKPKDIQSPTTSGAFQGFTGLKADSAKQYTVDILRATDILIQTKKVTGYANTDDEGYGTAAAAVNFTKLCVLDTETYHSSTVFNDVFDATSKTGTPKATGAYASAGNAHVYYNAVKGLTGGDAISTTNPLATSSIGTGTGATKFNFGTTTTPASGENGNSDIFEVQFTIFLNGWDLQCYDACQAQKFTVGMAFTTKDTSGLSYLAPSAK